MDRPPGISITEETAGPRPDGLPPVTHRFILIPLPSLPLGPFMAPEIVRSQFCPIGRPPPAPPEPFTPETLNQTRPSTTLPARVWTAPKNWRSVPPFAIEDLGFVPPLRSTPGSIFSGAAPSRFRRNDQNCPQKTETERTLPNRKN